MVMSSEEPPRKRRKGDGGDTRYRKNELNSDGQDTGASSVASRDGSDADYVDLVSNPDDSAKCYYEASQDGNPNHPVYEKRFKEAQKQIKDIIEKSQAFLNNHPHQHLSKINERLQSVVIFPPLQPVRIALVGDPGTGKSSLVNSLLDQRGLAITGASGSACTNVAVEFTAKLPNQTMNFAAEILFHSDELHAIIEDLVDDVRRPYANPNEEDDDQSQEESRMENSQQAYNADNMLGGLLRTHQKLKDQEELNKYLSRDEDDSDDSSKVTHIVHSIHEHVKSVIATQCTDFEAQTRIIQADNPKDLNSRLEPYTRLFDSEITVQFWPVVKRIRIGIQDCKLLQEVIIADLPGLHDDNRARLKATHEYLDGCDAAWVVSPIARVCNLKNVADVIRKLVSKSSSTKQVSLVCTFSDDGVNSNILSDAKRTMRTSQVAAVEARMKNEETKRESVRDCEYFYNKEKKRNDRKKLKQHLDRQKKEHKTAKYENKLALIKLRIELVCRTMQNAFPGVKVFGVSNILYDTLRFSNPTKHDHCLQASDTGIRDLRHHGLLMAAERKWNHTQRLFNGPLKGFKEHVGIFISNKGFEGREKWQENFKVPKEAINRLIEEYFEHGVESFREVIIDVIEEKKNFHRRSALEASQAWERSPFTWSVYRKFAQGRGTYGSDKIKQQSWNEQLALSVRQDLQTPWNSLEVLQDEDSKKFNITLSARLQSALDFERADGGSKKPKFVTEFEDLIARQSGSLWTAISDDFKGLRRAVGRISWKIHGTTPDSYIANKLEDTYLIIAGEAGRGMMRRMWAIMAAKLEERQDSVIDAIITRAAAEFQKLRKGHCREFKAEIGTIIQSIEDAFKAMMEDVPMDEELDGIRNELTEFHDNTIKAKMAIIAESLRYLERSI